MSNDLDPDLDRCNVGPDLGPNCFQSYQQTTKVPASKEGGKCKTLTFTPLLSHTFSKVFVLQFVERLLRVFVCLMEN